MRKIKIGAPIVLAAMLAAGVACAQAPSLEDLARMHSGGASSGVSSGSGSGGAGGASSASGSSFATPPSLAPAAGGSNSSALYGAIAFTADGSYSTAWKYKTKPEAEAYVATKCAAFGRGQCKVIGFAGSLCAGLASYQGSHSGRRYKLAFTGGGMTAADAQRQAMDRSNGDSRTRGRCQLRTVVCGDGR
jgi:hypothetical protein